MSVIPEWLFKQTLNTRQQQTLDRVKHVASSELRSGDLRLSQMAKPSMLQTLEPRLLLSSDPGLGQAAVQETTDTAMPQLVLATGINGQMLVSPSRQDSESVWTFGVDQPESQTSTSGSTNAFLDQSLVSGVTNELFRFDPSYLSALVGGQQVTSEDSNVGESDSIEPVAETQGLEQVQFNIEAGAVWESTQEGLRLTLGNSGDADLVLSDLTISDGWVIANPGLIIAPGQTDELVLMPDSHLLFDSSNYQEQRSGLARDVKVTFSTPTQDVTLDIQTALYEEPIAVPSLAPTDQGAPADTRYWFNGSFDHDRFTIDADAAGLLQITLAFDDQQDLDLPDLGIEVDGRPPFTYEVDTDGNTVVATWAVEAGQHDLVVTSNTESTLSGKSYRLGYEIKAQGLLSIEGLLDPFASQAAYQSAMSPTAASWTANYWDDTSSLTQNYVLTNHGSQAIDLSQITLSEGFYFAQSQRWLRAGESTQLRIQPNQVEGTFEGFLTIDSDGLMQSGGMVIPLKAVVDFAPNQTNHDEILMTRQLELNRSGKKWAGGVLHENDTDVFTFVAKETGWVQLDVETSGVEIKDLKVYLGSNRQHTLEHAAEGQAVLVYAGETLVIEIEGRDNTSSQTDFVLKIKQAKAPQGGILPVSRDFNADGYDDLAVDYDTKRVGVWLMEGEERQGFRAALDKLAAGDDWTLAAVADVNQDGVPDLWWHDRSEGRLVVSYLKWSSKRKHFYAAKSLDVLKPGQYKARLVTVADFDQDGTPDVLFQKKNNTTFGFTFEQKDSDQPLSKLVSTRLAGLSQQPEGKITSVIDTDRDGVFEYQIDHEDRNPEFEDTASLDAWSIETDNSRTYTNVDWVAPSSRWQFLRENDFNLDGLTDRLYQTRENGQKRYKVWYGGRNAVGDGSGWEPTYVWQAAYSDSVFLSGDSNGSLSIINLIDYGQKWGGVDGIHEGLIYYGIGSISNFAIDDSVIYNEGDWITAVAND